MDTPSRTPRKRSALRGPMSTTAVVAVVASGVVLVIALLASFLAPGAETAKILVASIALTLLSSAALGIEIAVATIAQARRYAREDRAERERQDLLDRPLD